MVAADTPSSGLNSVSTLSWKGPWEATRPLPPASRAPWRPRQPHADPVAASVCGCSPDFSASSSVLSEPSGTSARQRAPEGGGASSARFIICGLLRLPSVKCGPPQSLSVSWRQGERKRPRRRSERVPGASEAAAAQTPPARGWCRNRSQRPPRTYLPRHACSPNGKTPAEPKDIKPSQKACFPFLLT